MRLNPIIPSLLPFYFFAVCLAMPAYAEHQNTLQSTNSGGSSSMNPGQSLSMPSKPHFQTRADGPKYTPNPTTKELAKAGEKYQQQINEATKQTQSSIKESTNSFLSSLDKLKVPEAGGELLKQMAENIKTINTESNNTKAVEDIIGGTKAQGDTQVEYVKALAQRFGPNGGPPQPRQQQQAQVPTIGQLIQGFQSGRGTSSGGSGLDFAMGATPQGSGTAGPALGGPAPSSRRSYIKGGSARIYNLPSGVVLDD